MSIDPFSLAGTSILVTGASSGIGRACALAAAARGARVLVTGRDEGRLAQTLEALAGDGHVSVTADLTTPGGRTAVVSASVVLDGVVHSAGVHKLIPVKYLGDEDLADLQRINTTAPVLLTRDLRRARKLAEGASLVFVASIAPLLGSVGLVAYAASKAALIAASRVIARELAPRRVRANCLCPGTVRTPLLDGLGQAELDQAEARYPLGYGEPEDVAHAAVFLLSDAARWITGTALVMDGGLLL